MRYEVLRLTGALVALCPSVSAAWFFFIPGQVVDSVADAITGAEGKHCVTAAAKIGDRIRLPGGGVATVKSLSGSSIKCPVPELPIRALLDFGQSGEVTAAEAGQIPTQTMLGLREDSRKPIERPPEHSLSDPFSNPAATSFSSQAAVAVPPTNPVTPKADTPAHDPAVASGPPKVSPVSNASSPVTSLVDRLKKLEALRKEGLITEDEYQQKRKKLLDEL